MEVDCYLISGCRNILLRPAGAFCGEGVLQTAGKSWALAFLLLGQWKITEEARLPSAMPKVLQGPGGHKEKPETGKLLLTWGGEESGRRWGWGWRRQRGRGPALADVLTAVSHLGAGLLGFTLCHLQK